MLPDLKGHLTLSLLRLIYYVLLSLLSLIHPTSTLSLLYLSVLYIPLYSTLIYRSLRCNVKVTAILLYSTLLYRSDTVRLIQLHVSIPVYVHEAGETQAE